MVTIKTELMRLYCKNIIQYGPSDRIYKYNSIEKKNITNIFKRLNEIKTKKYKFIPRLYTFHLINENYIRTSRQWLDGTTLSKTVLNKKKLCLLMKQISHKLAKYNFVHGDISPSNIIINKSKLYLIDFLVDLKSRSGTPITSSFLCAYRIHNKLTDKIALYKTKVYYRKQLKKIIHKSVQY